MDYTQKKYDELCKALSEAGYKSLTVKELIERKDLSLNQKYLVLRHDVDRLPITSLQLAKIESKYGLKASYYYRIPYSYDEKIISQVAELGHEIGLHYETLDKTKGNFDGVREIMFKELDMMRRFGEIKTVSMHGNPLTKFDNRDIWSHYKYEEFDLIGEVYLSIDFEKVLYYSDTGRTWEDGKFNLKDVIPEFKSKVEEKPVLKTTNDLIDFIKSDDRNIYLLTHPERWSSNAYQFSKQYVKDRLINAIKSAIILKRKMIK